MGTLSSSEWLDASRHVTETREIEFETDRPDLGDVLTNVGGLAAYLIEYGPVVQDGNTFGVSETVRMTVRHVTSTRFAGLPVLHASSSGTTSVPASDGFARMPTDRQAASFVGLSQDATAQLFAAVEAQGFELEPSATVA